MSRTALAPGTVVTLDQPQTHYLRHVLRLKGGDQVLVFNGQDGEWRATLSDAGRRATGLTVQERTRPQTAPVDLHYLFAPLKHERLDYMVQKAVELGVSRLVPVITQHVQVTRVNLERMRANAIEAAEQCGILTLAEIAEPAHIRSDDRRPGPGTAPGVLRRGRGRQRSDRGARGAPHERGAAACRADRSRGRLCGSRARNVAAAAERGAAGARSANLARGYSGGRGAYAGAERCSAIGAELKRAPARAKASMRTRAAASTSKARRPPSA